MDKLWKVHDGLKLFGRNTPDRQDFIIANLREDVDKQVEVAVA